MKKPCSGCPFGENAAVYWNDSNVQEAAVKVIERHVENGELKPDGIQTCHQYLMYNQLDYIASKGDHDACIGHRNFRNTLKNI